MHALFVSICKYHVIQTWAHRFSRVTRHVVNRGNIGHLIDKFRAECGEWLHVLDSSLLAILDDFFSTRLLSNITVVAPILAINLAHFHFKLFFTKLSPHLGFKRRCLLLMLSVIVLV